MSTAKAPEDLTSGESSPFKEFPEFADLDNALARERSRLLGLPTELLQHVLLHTETGAFFTVLFTCKIVFYAAHAKHVLLHHINRMPGLRLGLKDLDTWSLFDLFRKRAAKGLYGADVSCRESVAFLSENVAPNIFCDTTPVQVTRDYLCTPIWSFWLTNPFITSP